jgi:hypothetical protein
VARTLPHLARLRRDLLLHPRAAGGVTRVSRARGAGDDLARAHPRELRDARAVEAVCHHPVRCHGGAGGARDDDPGATASWPARSCSLCRSSRCSGRSRIALVGSR